MSLVAPRFTEMIDFCDRNATEAFVRIIVNTDPDHDIYKVLTPLFLTAEAASLLVNGLLVIVRNTHRMRSSPMLILSLNLAATDGVISFLVSINLLHNYLSLIYSFDLLTSFHLTVLEVVRLSSFFASALHLLALTWLHYEATINPLHHR